MSDFQIDDKGRTILFHYASIGDEEEVKNVIFKLSGTGMSPQRLALINIKDHEGLTAADVAENAGHHDIVMLLRKEKGRMEYFE